ADGGLSSCRGDPDLLCTARAFCVGHDDATEAIEVSCKYVGAEAARQPGEPVARAEQSRRRARELPAERACEARGVDSGRPSEERRDELAAPAIALSRQLGLGLCVPLD